MLKAIPLFFLLSTVSKADTCFVKGIEAANQWVGKYVTENYLYEIQKNECLEFVPASNTPWDRPSYKMRFWAFVKNRKNSEEQTTFVADYTLPCFNDEEAKNGECENPYGAIIDRILPTGSKLTVEAPGMRRRKPLLIERQEILVFTK